MPLLARALVPSLAPALLATVGLLAAAPAPAQQLPPEVVLDGVAAQVGSEIVLVSEVREIAAPILQRMKEAGRPPAEMAQLEADALERLIEDKLIATVVKRAEVTASPAEIDKAIQGIAAETGLTLGELRASVEQHGLTYAEYRDKIRREIEKDKAIGSAVRAQIRLEPGEVKALYDERYGDQPDGGDEVHLRHIVVAFGRPMRDDQTACRIAEEARAEIAAGQPFGRVAAAVSDANLERRGDLGWVHEKDLAGWMAGAVERLEPGQLSPVIQMPFGCNVLELVDRRSYTPVRFEDVKPQLENEVYGKKAEVEYREWINGLREQVFVERKGRYAEAIGPLPSGS